MIDMKTDDFARRGIDSPESDSEWRAFRYVLGELSPAETEAFEEVLAADQAMRELVARTTSLVTNLLEAGLFVDEPGTGRNGASPVEPAVISPAAAAMPARRQKASSWAVTGLVAAVCCCVAVGVTLFSLRVTNELADLTSGDVSDGGAGNLVAIWSEQLAALAPEQAATEPASSETAAAERTESAPAGDAEDARVATATENAADDADVPPWMVAAVELGQVHKGDGSSSEIREN